MDAYEIMRQEIKKDLHNNRLSKIHISFDLWTSPNSYTLMVVVAYYVNKSFQNVTRLIILRNLRGNHSGKNIITLFIEIIKDFEIKDLFGYFIINNAESNDIYIEFLFSRLISNFTANERSHRRFRY
jgi:hypothetical protein